MAVSRESWFVGNSGLRESWFPGMMVCGESWFLENRGSSRVATCREARFFERGISSKKSAPIVLLLLGKAFGRIGMSLYTLEIGCFGPFSVTPLLIIPHRCSLSRLSKDRKKRKPHEATAKPEDMGSMKRHTIPLDDNSTDSAGLPIISQVTCMTLFRETQRLVLAGMDGHLRCVDLSSNRVIDRLGGDHATEGTLVTEMVAHEHATRDVLYSIGEEGPIRVWECDRTASGVPLKFAYHTLMLEGSDVLNRPVSMTCHPNGDYIACASIEGRWSLIDVKTPRILVELADDPPTSGRSLIRFHPDGLILAVGRPDGRIHVWDLKTQACAAYLEAHAGPITCVAFSENGYYMASSSESESCVRLWDLRKLSNFHTIPLSSDQTDATNFVSIVVFDESGHYLAAGTSKGSVHVYRVKSWQELIRFTDHAQAVIGMNFGQHARTLYTLGRDGTVLTYSSL
jgi:pre-mRNA-processing factor 19